MVRDSVNGKELSPRMPTVGARFTLAPDSSDFCVLLRQRACASWLNLPTILVLVVCLFLQNLWVHWGIPAVAAVYPYGTFGLALLVGLFLLDPLTIGYLIVLRRSITKALGSFPLKPDLVMAGVEPLDIFLSLRWPLVLVLVMEMGINKSIIASLRAMDLLDYPDVSWIRTAVSFLLMASTIFPVATILMLAVSVSRNLVLQFTCACMGLLPLLLVVAMSDLWSFQTIQWRDWGYQAAAIPIIIILGQIYGWLGSIAFCRIALRKIGS